MAFTNLRPKTQQAVYRGMNEELKTPNGVFGGGSRMGRGNRPAPVLAPRGKDWLQGLVGLTYIKANEQIKQARQVGRLFKIDDVLMDDLSIPVGSNDIMLTLATPQNFRPSGYGTADAAHDRIAASNFIAAYPNEVLVASVQRK